MITILDWYLELLKFYLPHKQHQKLKLGHQSVEESGKFDTASSEMCPITIQ